MNEQLTPFVDLRSTHDQLRSELDGVWKACVDGSGFIGGAAVERFEQDWAAFCGTTHAIGVANGTDALEIALGALGVGAGDDVVVPANTFVATAEAVANVGARPVFADVDPETLLITADTLSAALTDRTAAVMVVHLYGQMPDMPAILDVARKAGVAVVEDAAQAHGATWDGRPAGSFGDIAGFSFYPGKNLGALGDGGAIVTSRDDLATAARTISNHGRTDTPFVHAAFGRNSRLDGLQAGLLSTKLPHLLEANAARRVASEQYRSRLAEHVTITALRPEALSAHHLEVIRVPDPEGLRSFLGEHGVPTGRHYPISCTTQPAFERFDPVSCPVAEAAVVDLVSLPMHPHLDAAVVDRICDLVIEHAG